MPARIADLPRVGPAANPLRQNPFGIHENYTCVNPFSWGVAPGRYDRRPWRHSSGSTKFSTKFPTKAPNRFRESFRRSKSASVASPKNGSNFDVIGGGH